ncbi:precorrin-6y C5,15-methyltransferase (decarboxylating) subunit CbiE [Candidatus Accumulibacter sp. ACC003]|uniref:precorrin-6y C5,15-methyltransferase (decarboxylating) subunit CbiE n=1 Tax=Candidatus Accumulibacter sp. ACC003 TaxID=2823334 RepID=UPI0025BE3934|nr:precorrin-6y C5,15-methyltransferase (decarboxylating) subunit CbiE [Candidatus Accumulibacter sp. ACC003]
MKPCEPCAVIGILDDGWAGLSESARQRLLAARLVIGAARTLALVRPQLPTDCQLQDMDAAIKQVPEWIAAARADGRSVAVLATGDPLCHGIAPLLIGKLGAAQIEVLPAPSTVQLLCARLGKPWQNLRIASCHGADAGEWWPGASPAHGLYRVLRAIALQPLVAVFTGAENTPARLARALLSAGHAADLKVSVACRLLLPDEQIFPDLPLAEVAEREFPEPNVLLVERVLPSATAVLGREDHEYVQRAPEKGLITKQEARVLSLAKLRLAADAIVWDIGAGSGAVGLEAAALAPLGHVWAIEKNAGDAANARANAVRFRASNYTLVEGRAPAHLDSWPDPDAVFIGGSGGELAELIERILGRLKPAGRLVMNFVTLENLATATRVLAASGVPWELVQLQASRSQPILDMHRLAAQNPVWILTARKEEECPATEN